MAKSVNDTLKKIKSNLRGILLSEVGGVRVETLLSQYEEICSEPLDYESLGFISLHNFLRSFPDVARVDVTADGLTRVFGVGMNEMNVTARKSLSGQGKNLPEMVHIRSIPPDATHESLLSHLWQYSIESLRLFPSRNSQIGSFLLSRSEIGQLLEDKSIKLFRGSYLKFIYPAPKKPPSIIGNTVDHRNSYGTDYCGSTADSNGYSANYNGYTIDRHNNGLDHNGYSGNFNGYTIDRNNFALDGNGYAARQDGYATTRHNNYNSGSSGYSSDQKSFAIGHMNFDKPDIVPLTGSHQQESILDSVESSVCFVEKTSDNSTQSTHHESTESTDYGVVSFVIYVENLPKSVKLDDVVDVFRTYGDFKAKMIHEETLDSDDEEEVNCYCMLKFHLLESAEILYREKNILRVLDKPVRLDFTKILSPLKKFADFDNLIVNLEGNTKKRVVSYPQTKQVPEKRLPISMERCTLNLMYKDVFPGQNIDFSWDLASSVIQLMPTHIEESQPKYFWGLTDLNNPNVGKVLDIGRFEPHFKPYDFKASRAVILHDDGYYCRVWVKLIKSRTCELFFVDFGNTEMDSVDHLLTPPDEIWDLPPIVRPFKLESQGFKDLTACLNTQVHCHVEGLEEHILVLSDVDDTCQNVIVI